MFWESSWLLWCGMHAAWLQPTLDSISAIWLLHTGRDLLAQGRPRGAHKPLEQESEPGCPRMAELWALSDLVSLNSGPFPPSGSTCLACAPESGVPRLSFLKAITNLKTLHCQNLHLIQGPFPQAEHGSMLSVPCSLLCAAIPPALGRKAHPLLPPSVLLLQPTQGWCARKKKI